jgi:hypothetical protein
MMMMKLKYKLIVSTQAWLWVATEEPQYIKEDFMSLHFKAQEYASCRDIFMRQSLIKLIYGKNIFCLF